MALDGVVDGVVALVALNGRVRVGIAPAILVGQLHHAAARACRHRLKAADTVASRMATAGRPSCTACASLQGASNPVDSGGLAA